MNIKAEFQIEEKAKAVVITTAFLDAFELRCKALNISKRTAHLYTYNLQVFARWVEGVPEVKPTHIRSFLGHLRDKGNSDATVDTFYRVIKTYFNFLLKDGLISFNPMLLVERPRRERRRAKAPTTEGFEAMLKAIPTGTALGLRDYTLLLFLADTGARLTEALTLTVNSLNLEQGRAVVYGKGRKERVVAFGERTAAMLRQWLQVRGTLPAREVFVNRYGRPLAGCTVDQMMKRYTKQAGIAEKRLSPHSLRHYFALQSIKNGMDVFALQRLLGHTTLEMVRQYVDMCDDLAVKQHGLHGPIDSPSRETRGKILFGSGHGKNQYT